VGRLEGTVAVVTGGECGTGPACARRFVAEGARVGSAGRSVTATTIAVDGGTSG
jgi:NADP-dependent 3-hydroxy acid dehydrogenase YdfG